MQKKTFVSIYLILPLFLAAGCRVAGPVEPESATCHLTATLERQAQTRTQLGQTEEGKYYAFWSAGDELAVYFDGLSMQNKYILAQGAGTEKGIFAGTLSGSRFVALYPYGDRTQEGVRDGVLHLELPADQNYSPGSFGEGAFPMVAAGEGTELAFKNLCAALKVSLTGKESVRSIRFVAADPAMAVCGPATVRTDFSEAPELVMEAGGPDSVTLQCVSVQLSEDDPTDFFLAIPAGTYHGGFSLEITTFTGTFTRTFTSDVTFVRSQFRYIAPFRCEGGGETDPEVIPYNQIWYYTSDGKPFVPNSTPIEKSTDRTLLSHSYVDGKYVLEYDGWVTKVSDFAFGAGYNLTEVRLPDTVRELGRYSFAASFIRKFRTPDQLESVGDGLFYYCDQLERIYGKWASSDGKSIVVAGGRMIALIRPHGEDYVVPAGVISLGEELFWSDREVRHVILPEGLQVIEDKCFVYCDNLETIYMPSSVKTAYQYSVNQCPKLRRFEGDSPLLWNEHCMVNDKGTVLACAIVGLEDFAFPEGVVKLQWCNLFGSDDLRSVTFPSSVMTIDPVFCLDCNNVDSFYGAIASADHHCAIRDGRLMAVTHCLPSSYTLPGGLLTINERVFTRSTVRRLVIPDSVTSIGNRAFLEAADLTSVVLPSGLNTLNYDTFSGCTSLDTVYCRSFIPPSYEERSSEAYFGHDGLVIYVPQGAVNQYKSAATWSNYAQYIQGYDYGQDPPAYYVSTDYSQDGRVTTLQTASAGRGIDIVLMGDGYSDRQIADGTYASVMNRMAEAFFSVEPYASYRNLFNVYSVTVVSGTEGYDHSGQALGGWFGGGTKVGGNDPRCQHYALNAVSSDRMDDALIIVAMNSAGYGGTCYMYSGPDGDYGRGNSVAYFTADNPDATLVRLVHHEAGGHGFAKLADEYAYENNGAIPQSVMEERLGSFVYGWWKNADFTGDPNRVKWKHFLSDVRYQYDGLGCFEGAFTYWTGAWRPTQNSIMRDNTGGFNAPSREAIWYRIHKLAYGEAWNYDYEAFVAYDSVNRKTAASTSSVRPSKVERTWMPTAPPVVIGRRWNEPETNELNGK